MSETGDGSLGYQSGTRDVWVEEETWVVYDTGRVPGRNGTGHSRSPTVPGSGSSSVPWVRVGKDLEAQE